MCGIAGEIAFQTDLSALPQGRWDNMWAALARRGPDQAGIYRGRHATLLHRRLSVIDIEGGRQPMTLEMNGEKYILVYNGELYNTQELRRDLQGMGHRFLGHSDTEVLLHAYAQWGEGCLDMLNGIFAFALWEENAGRLFMARDPMGVKPLFYRSTGDGLLWGSELKAILGHPDVTPRLGRQGVLDIMLLGPGRTPGCGVFEGIEELRPGWCMMLTRHGEHKRPYFALEARPHPDDFPTTVETVRLLVTDAIRRQLVSDVEVGAFLSGGLDSSIIAAVAAQVFREKGERLNTFSVDYEGNDRYFHATKFQPSSDSEYVDYMNHVLGAKGHLLTITTDQLVDALFESVDARDLPGMADVDASMLLLCRQIKRDVTVALSGECADELFGGYPWYRDPQIRQAEGFPWAQSTMYRAGFLRDDWLEGVDPADYVDSRYRACAAATGHVAGEREEDAQVRQMTRLNMDYFMQTLLDRKDRCSMFSGLEVRVPFCDKRLAQYLYNVPWAYKDAGGQEKGLLREAVMGLVPDLVRLRKKSPYPKTHNPDYLRAVQGRMMDVMASANQPLFDIVKADKVVDLLTDQRSQPWYGQLMNTPQTIAYLLQVNYWLNSYRVELRP